MAPDEYIKDATIHPRLEGESVANELHPFAPLHTEEEQTKPTCQQKPIAELLYAILLNCAARLKHCVAAQQEKHSVNAGYGAREFNPDMRRRGPGNIADPKYEKRSDES